MSMPNYLPWPDTAEVAPLSILSQLSASPGNFTVTQTVLQPSTRGPAYGPRAHSKENRLLFIAAALPGPEGGAKLWLDGRTQYVQTGTYVRLEAGTGISWCILNEGDEELIYLEFVEVHTLPSGYSCWCQASFTEDVLKRGGIINDDPYTFFPFLDLGGP